MVSVLAALHRLCMVQGTLTALAFPGPEGAAQQLCGQWRPGWPLARRAGLVVATGLDGTLFLLPLPWGSGGAVCGSELRVSVPGPGDGGTP